MTEEEIIEVLQRVILANRFDGLYTSICIIIEAIQGLLDLYNKEKEKNKELETTIGLFKNANKNMATIVNESYGKNFISKDKIRDIIENLEISINDIKDNHIVDVIIYQDIKRLELKKEALEKLLED